MHRLTFAAALLLPMAVWPTALFAQTHWPPPRTPAGNPVTADKVLLGKVLFWDEQLSSTGSVACGTCHILSHGGADPRSFEALHPGPDGVFGTADDSLGSPGVPRNDGAGRYDWVPGFGAAPQVTRRTAPSVINAAYLSEMFWDGRANDGVFRDPLTQQVVLASDAQLENLIAQPPLDAVEMGHPGRTWSDVVARVQNVMPLALASNLPAAMQNFVGARNYAQLFSQAFGTPGVDASRIVMAIASYLRTLVSDGSPVDQHLADGETLTGAALQGFQFARIACARCHQNISASVLAFGPVGLDFRNTGVRPIAEDVGRQAVTNRASDAGKFKVPDLRNVALRGPFFHGGSARTLADVLAFYGRGGDFHVNQDPLMVSMQQQVPAQRTDLLALLDAFTDPRVRDETPPFDRPRLFAEGPNANVSVGAGTAGTGGLAPRAIAVEAPRIGATVTLAVDSALPGELVLIGWDVMRTSTPWRVLGVDVHLALSPAVHVGLVGGLAGTAGAGSGHASTSIALPMAPELRGARLFGQWLVTDPSGSRGFAASQAFGLTVF
ncbi:MAG: hypothetical protein NXI31_11615 [bacterium]|nr:hypothetical protein [bacterium]